MIGFKEVQAVLGQARVQGETRGAFPQPAGRHRLLDSVPRKLNQRNYSIWLEAAGKRGVEVSGRRDVMCKAQRQGNDQQGSPSRTQIKVGMLARGGMESKF